jgi:diacylglycerol kinase (ATP)
MDIDTGAHNLAKTYQAPAREVARPPSAVIIANPVSGSFPQHYAHDLDETLSFLRQRDWQVDLYITKAPGGAQKLAHAAVTQHVDIVIAAGGDGTINEIIQELAGSKTALGVLPYGTVNIWAREMGIPLQIVDARKVLLNGQIRSIDLGRCNDRFFLLMAGIGIDGAVTQAIEKKPIKRLGALGYLLIATWLGLGYPNFQARLRINNKRPVKLRALQIIVGNTQLYGGALKFTWEAKCDDGQLDVCVVRKRSMLGRIMVVIDFLLRRKNRQQWVRYYTATSIEINTRRPVAIQIDGEPVGHTPASFTIAPGALKALVPQKIPQGLFSKEKR